MTHYNPGRIVSEEQARIRKLLGIPVFNVLQEAYDGSPMIAPGPDYVELKADVEPQDDDDQNSRKSNDQCKRCFRLDATDRRNDDLKRVNGILRAQSDRLQAEVSELRKSKKDKKKNKGKKPKKLAAIPVQPTAQPWPCTAGTAGAGKYQCPAHGKQGCTGTSRAEDMAIAISERDTDPYGYYN